MATISSRGKKSTDAISGGLSFEQDKNRIIGRDENKNPSLILSSEPGEQALFEIARQGYDVFTATDDQKVMSSKFNMWKIIANGKVPYYSGSTFVRSGTVSLDATTYIGYQHETWIETGIDFDKVLNTNADVLINIITGKAHPFLFDGFAYHNGTNIVWRHCYFYFNPLNSTLGSNDGGNLVLVQRFRVLGGSYTLTPLSSVSQNIKWSICNQTLADTSGGGVIGPGSGKYYYLDKIHVDKDGDITTSLASSTVELVVGEWELFI